MYVYVYVCHACIVVSVLIFPLSTDIPHQHWGFHPSLNFHFVVHALSSTLQQRKQECNDVNGLWSAISCARFCRCYTNLKATLVLENHRNFIMCTDYCEFIIFMPSTSIYDINYSSLYAIQLDYKVVVEWIPWYYKLI
jgi:hypothetical protein